MSAHDHHEGYICKIHTEKSKENKGLLLHEVSERVNEEHRSQVTHRSGHGDGRGRPVLPSGTSTLRKTSPSKGSDGQGPVTRLGVVCTRDALENEEHTAHVGEGHFQKQ